MNDTEFEAALTRLYQHAPPCRDEAEFLMTLARRHAVARLRRNLFLGFLGGAGGLATLYWVIQSEVLSCCRLVQLPLRLLDAASSSWLMIILLFVSVGVWQRIQDNR